MAPDQNKSPSGGNKPKPAAPPAGKPGQSAKDKSRAQSRPVSAKAPTGKSGNSRGATKTAGAPGKGGNTGKGTGTGKAGVTGKTGVPGKGGNAPRPGSRPVPQPRRSRISGTMMAWGAVGLVVVIIVVLVVVKATGGSGTSTAGAYTPVTAAPASVVNDVSTIPLSVYNKVGVTSSTAAVVPPTVLKNQPPMTLDGKTPAMLYYGAEYCPYCAAERWAMAAALARFGTWSGLKITASSHTDLDAITHTFSFYGASLTSSYIHFTAVEQYTNIPTSGGQGYTTLQSPTKAEAAILTKYSSSKYNPNASTSGGISFPFVDINNVLLFSGASYDPGILAGQTWSQIAGNLSDASNPATQAIVATANYMTAGVCAASNNQPAAVCTSPGVEAANKALKLS